MEGSNENSGAAKTLKIQVKKLIQNIVVINPKVVNFINHYEKSVSQENKVLHQEARSGAKALKNMINIVTEYNQLYEKLLSELAIDEDAFNAIEETHELYDLTPIRTGHLENKWNEVISKSKLGFAGFQKTRPTYCCGTWPSLTFRQKSN